MRGHNAEFTADPLNYVSKRAVNNLTWFAKTVRAGNASPESALNNALAIQKSGFFDLETTSISAVEFKVTGPAGLIGDTPIGAYWCPFIQGGGLPGYVDIPKKNPPLKFVFTAAMNGCRLVVTNYSATHYRVYHNQHPDGNNAESQRIWNLIKAQGHEIVSHFGWDEYAPAGNAFPPNAFNFLYYRNGNWNYVSQAQTFDMVTKEVRPTPGGALLRSIL